MHRTENTKFSNKYCTLSSTFAAHNTRTVSDFIILRDLMINLMTENRKLGWAHFYTKTPLCYHNKPIFFC